MKKTTKLRWRRRFKRSKNQVETISVQAEQGIEKHFFKRLYRLGDVRRFVAGWVILVILLGVSSVMQLRALSPYYQTLQPVPGGIYTEGILGTFTTANPLYATTSVDGSVARLVFAGLMKYNSQNQLVGDLATSVKPDERGVVYTVTLNPEAYWHDGKPVTPDDVVFTYGLIQNPDAKSPLRANWKSVKVEKLDDQTVRFTLPHALSSFPHLLTNGIVPKHVLEHTPASQLRTVDFNTSLPIGSGPFKWDSIQISGQTPELREEQIGLSANEAYHGGAPKLDRVIIKAIHNQEGLIEQFKAQKIDAIVGLDKRPDSIKPNTDITEYELVVNGEVMLFFKNSSEIFKDKAVRQALTQGTNRNEIITGLGYAVAPVKGPLLQSHIGYDPAITQFGYDVKNANAILDQAGWVRGADGKRSKDKIPLKFQLYSQNNSDYAYVTQVLQRQWKELGVDVDVVLQEDAELQSTLALHAYDALLYGITVGSDPDVYAYWHSSQADARASNRLNFSEFKSSAADSALDGGRTRTDAGLRAAKYKPFLTAWRDEAPAIGLYQPRFLYITRGRVFGLDSKVVNVGVDRYANVQNWRIRTERVTIQ